MNRVAVSHERTGAVRNLQFAVCILQFAIPCLFSASAIAAPSPAGPDAIIHKVPTWRLPQTAELKRQASGWIVQNAADAAARTKAVAIVSGIAEEASGTESLDRLGEAFAAADPRVAELTELCSRPRSRAILPSFSWLTDPKTAPIVAANMRLYFGRWLVQGQWFEEALDQIATLKPEDVAAPAELLFYQGVVHHRMLHKDEGLKILDRLLDGADFCPRRYVAVARLMQADLKMLEEETLDHVARRMEDIERRLDLGRAGPKVLKVEKGVIESLDKMIKKIEDSQKQQNSDSNQLQSSKPADASRPMGGKAPGEVDKKDIGRKSGWGDLPPKQREEALQQMGRGFPPHYRDAIEHYFRKLATEHSEENK